MNPPIKFQNTLLLVYTKTSEKSNLWNKDFYLHNFKHQHSSMALLSYASV